MIPNRDVFFWTLLVDQTNTIVSKKRDRDVVVFVASNDNHLPEFGEYVAEPAFSDVFILSSGHL